MPGKFQRYVIATNKDRGMFKKAPCAVIPPIVRIEGDVTVNRILQRKWYVVPDLACLHGIVEQHYRPSAGRNFQLC